MTCQFCNKNPANILFTIIVNNEKKDIRICNKCAEEKGFSNPMGGIPLLLSGIIFGIAEEKMIELINKETSSKNIVCNDCGLTYKEFKTSGLLGCESCYKAFEEDLKVILRRIHGNNKHLIIKNKKSSLIEKTLSGLRKELEEAVKQEEFEEAAQIRDKIRDIEKNAK